jgi:dTDP-4-amino-4,6-dideoxygalactose transaminase
MGEDETRLVMSAFDSNWIAPVGPDLDLFEQELCEVTGANYAAALSSGTAGIHLGLQLLGTRPGDEVLCSTFTFIGSVSPAAHLGATPVFVDSEPESWNMSPRFLREALIDRKSEGACIRAVIVVHLYGQSANIDALAEVCREFGVPLVEDAAESLGATYQGRHTGTLGRFGVYSFNGNKIITTSGGGAVVSDDEEFINQIRFLATQARDPAPHYEHSHLGYNYRLSNLLAALGRGQLRCLDARVAARRRNFAIYERALQDIPGVRFMPETSYGLSNRWLTCLTISENEFGCSSEGVRAKLEDENIESRPLWKPMHLQPVFSHCQYFGGRVAEGLFADGLCLPSGSNLQDEDLERIIEIIRGAHIRNGPVV